MDRLSVRWFSEPRLVEGNGTPEAELRACALATDAGITLVTVNVDEQSVPVTEAETGLLRIHPPEDNIFGLTGADRNGLSVAHGFPVLLHLLARGTHTSKSTPRERSTPPLRPRSSCSGHFARQPCPDQTTPSPGDVVSP